MAFGAASSGVHQVKLFTESSFFAWAGVFNPDEISIVAADYWPNDSFSCDTAVKETLVLANSLSTFKDRNANARIDVFVDSSALVHYSTLKLFHSSSAFGSQFGRPSFSLLISRRCQVIW